MMMLRWFSKEFRFNWPSPIYSHFSHLHTMQHVLSNTAYCIRLYSAGWKLNSSEALCKFGIIFGVHSTSGIIYTVFSCHVLISSSFISIIIIITIIILVFVSENFCFQSCVTLVVLIIMLFPLLDRLNILSSLSPLPLPPHETKCC